jgi:hypothetical protein
MFQGKQSGFRHVMPYRSQLSKCPPSETYSPQAMYL